MAIIQDWKIRSRAHRCSDTDRPFEDGERVCTGIFADPESDGYLRKDYCMEAWDRLKASLEPYSFWQATYRIPEEEPDAEDLGRESPEGMLRRMIDEDESHTENARYILVLMLERKKILVPVDAQEMESRRMLFYEHKENGDVFVVADPQLRLDEVAEIQEEVALLLQGKRPARDDDTAPEEVSDPEAAGERSPESDTPDANIDRDSEENATDDASVEALLAVEEPQAEINDDLEDSPGDPNENAV